MIFNFDFSKLPSDVALFLTNNSGPLDEFVNSMSSALALDTEDHQVFRDSLVGVVAELVDDYLPKKPA